MHFCEAGQWKAAVKMFRKANQWEDVVRVAKAHGGVPACKQVCLIIGCCQAPSNMLERTELITYTFSLIPATVQCFDSSSVSCR